VGLIDRGRLLASGSPRELKQWMQGSILEIRSARPRKATTVLREQLEAERVGLFGDRVHVVCAEPETTARRAEQILSQAGLPASGIRPIEPSLEDVFVSMLARRPGSPDG
jgi:ABC-2 type transport system ATP-binding protein